MGKVGTGNCGGVKEFRSEGNWKIRIWEDGFKECWYRGGVSFSSETIGAGIAEMKVMQVDVPLPIRYTEEPCATASVDWGISEWAQATPSRDKIGLRKFVVGNNSQNIKVQKVSIQVAGY